jgi:hypothetical protein
MAVALAAVLAGIPALSPLGTGSAEAANPFLPLWERIPDGEPRIFKDPETGQDRLYVYGSHDSRLAGYCGPEHVVWSAPVDDPTNWRQEGTAFHVDQLNGAPYIDSDGKRKQLVVDTGPVPAFWDDNNQFHQGSPGKNIRVQLYAPDVVYHPENQKYYMYLFVDGMWHVNASSNGVPPIRRHLMFVASSDSPAGPFTDPKFVTLAFDPAVLVDTEKNADGKSRVYLYWTPEETRNSYAAELDPNDMATILPNTTHYPNKMTDRAPFNTMPDWDAPFYMFEGSSIRKAGDWYIMAYCRGERATFNATSNISEIGWAYAPGPFGPWTYGGVVVSNKGERIVDPYTDAPNTQTYTGGNIHGGMVDLDGQWYQIYHRDSGISGKRQAMAEPFDLRFDAANKPVIDQVELTSQGFEIDGLDPFKEQYASYASYILPASGPNAPHFFSQVNDATINFDPNAQRDNWYPATNLGNQTWLGYKYFNFGSGVTLTGEQNLKLTLSLKEYLPGVIRVYSSAAKTKFDDPEKPKTMIGTITLAGTNENIHTVEGIINTRTLVGKVGIYFEFLSNETGEMAQVNKLQFSINDPTAPPTQPPTQPPTEQPTDDPSTDPSTDPSDDPSDDPSQEPSTEPSKTQEPSGDVSKQEAERQAEAAALAAAKAAVTSGVAEANALLTQAANYTPASVEALKTAVANASAVASNPAASLPEVQAAMTALIKGVAGLAQTPSQAIKSVKAGTVKVTGKLTVGKKLTAKTAKWTKGTTFTYKWYAGSKAIKGATGKTLKLTKSLKGKKIKVRVVGSRAGYVAVAKTSAASKRVK